MRSGLGWYWLLAALPGSLPGAATITGPVAGYVVESSGPGMRAILGVPGSFRFSDALPLPEGVTRIHLAPRQDFALVERADSRLAVLHLSGGAVDPVVAIDGAMAAADWVAFSPSGTSAILLSSSAGRLQLISGLPDTPRVAMELDSATLPERPRTAAVSDDGQTLLIASGRAVYLVRRDGAAQLLMQGREIVSVAVFRNGTDAAVSDRGAGSVHLLRNVSSAPVEQVLAAGLKGLGRLYPSWGGETIFVARPGARAVSSIDVASGEITSCDSAAGAVTLDPLRNRDTFLISARPHHPGWIYYCDGGLGRVVFVPAAHPATENAQ
ncbi:MAG TPA: hypothetical protein VGZ73_10950 [Bryobacteraceae bacterium]|nr:hypothetical protein [Bryobacteraceae bacterium]